MRWSNRVEPREVDYKEVFVERRGKETLKGQTWMEGDTVVVESKDGRHKSMALGSGSPEEIAKQLLVELDEEQIPAGTV
jgi:hypothetical protein